MVDEYCFVIEEVVVDEDYFVGCWCFDWCIGWYCEVQIGMWVVFFVVEEVVQVEGVGEWIVDWFVEYQVVGQVGIEVVVGGGLFGEFVFDVFEVFWQWIDLVFVFQGDVLFVVVFVVDVEVFFVVVGCCLYFQFLWVGFGVQWDVDYGDLVVVFFVYYQYWFVLVEGLWWWVFFVEVDYCYFVGYWFVQQVYDEVVGLGGQGVESGE